MAGVGTNPTPLMPRPSSEGSLGQCPVISGGVHHSVWSDAGGERRAWDLRGSEWGEFVRAGSGEDTVGGGGAGMGCKDGGAGVSLRCGVSGISKRAEADFGCGDAGVLLF